MFIHASTIARAARFNNCPVVSIHKGCNAVGQTQWDMYIGTDSGGGFKESTTPTRKEAIERAQDVVTQSGGYIKELWAERGDVLYPIKLK